MFKKKTNTTEQEEQGIIYSENIQIPISKGENNNALIIESNDSEVQQKYIEPNLSQADKTILRTIILLNNSKYAWGDLANTINQSAA